MKFLHSLDHELRQGIISYCWNEIARYPMQRRNNRKKRKATFTSVKFVDFLQLSWNYNACKLRRESSGSCERPTLAVKSLVNSALQNRINGPRVRWSRFSVSFVNLRSFRHIPRVTHELPVNQTREVSCITAAIFQTRQVSRFLSHLINFRTWLSPF